MAVTGTETNHDLCEDALRKLGVISIRQQAKAEEMQLALRQLNRMLKAWQGKGWNVWTKTSMSHVLTVGAGQVLDPVRPLEIASVRIKRGEIETPLEEMSRDEYDTLPVKNSAGCPTAFYYDRQRENAVLYVWPVLATVSGETLEITYQREVEDIEADQPADYPVEWYDAIVYSLAARLADDFAINSPMVQARADILLRDALAFDHDGSVYFVEPRY